MLVDPAGQLNGGNGLTTDLLRQHIESIGEISKRMGMVNSVCGPLPHSDLILFAIILLFT